jgi:DNA-binding MarR family transcriptional regulator
MGPGEQLYLAVQHAGRVFGALDADLGLSPARFSLLATLRYAGEQRIGRLAELEGVSQPTITRLVGGLERDGLVVRRRRADDGRASVVELIPAGRALVRRARARKIAWIQRVLDDVGDAERVSLDRAARQLDAAALHAG